MTSSGAAMVIEATAPEMEATKFCDQVGAVVVGNTQQVLRRRGCTEELGEGWLRIICR